MSERIVDLQFGEAWGDLLKRLSFTGSLSRPRGIAIRELRDVVLTVQNARNNILVCHERRPNYRFMVAEWLWIWFGRSDVASISIYNPKIADFSDDGLTFAGAYGPKIHGQWNRVVAQLRADTDTRQAIIQVWDPTALNTRDVACTLALQFMIRGELLHTSVYMRSSDIWLGLPYDFFTFSMLGNILAGRLGVGVGEITFHLGSSHLYESNFDAAANVLHAHSWNAMASPILSDLPPWQLEDTLENLPQLDLKSPWIYYALKSPWIYYARTLHSGTQAAALEWLRKARDETK